MKKEKKKSQETQITLDKNPRESTFKPHESAFIEWQTPEFEYAVKDVSWYWLSLMVAIVLFALAIWQGNFLFSIFIIIAWLVIVYLSRRFPTVWQFKIDENGVDIYLPKNRENEKFYAYKEIEGFDIHPMSDEYKELVFKIKARFSPYLKINIRAADEEKIKNFLTKFLPQEEYQPSFIDSLSKLIKF